MLQQSLELFRMQLTAVASRLLSGQNRPLNCTGKYRLTFQAMIFFLFN